MRSNVTNLVLYEYDYGLQVHTSAEVVMGCETIWVSLVLFSKWILSYTSFSFHSGCVRLDEEVKK